MKVLFLADSFLPHAGGSRVYYFNLYQHLAATCSDQITILTKKVPGWEEFDERLSTQSLRIVRQGKPLPNWKYHHLPKIVPPLVGSLRLIYRERIDLMHCGDLYPPGMIGLALKRMGGVPYLAFCHGEEITQTDCRRYQPIVRNRIYQEADAVVAASSFAVENLLRIGIPGSQIHKITPGVDCERFLPTAPRQDLIDQFSLQDKAVLLTVSRLVPRKGHRVALQAIAKILAEQPSLRYLIVGRGPEEENLRRFSVELGLSGVVHFVGYVPEEELPDYYNLCHLFVMPNGKQPGGDIEGFGMVFLEANACGKPLIGGRSGGSAEAVLHGITGFLVNPEDVDELAEALKTLLRNPELCQSFGMAGLRRARAEFGWRSRAEALHQINKEIKQRSRRVNWAGATAGRELRTGHATASTSPGARHSKVGRPEEL